MNTNKIVLHTMSNILEKLEISINSFPNNMLLNEFNTASHKWFKQLQDMEEEEELEKFFKNWQTGESNIRFFIQEMKKFPSEEKKLIAPLFIEIKNIMESFYIISKKITQEVLLEKDKNEKLLVELDDPNPIKIGKIHPLRTTMIKLYNILNHMGFTMKTADNLEKEEYNFDYLNIPKNHPARDMQDTFFINSEKKENIYL